MKIDPRKTTASFKLDSPFSMKMAIAGIFVSQNA